MKKRTYYELDLTFEEQDAIDTAHEYDKLFIIDDPWRGTKRELECWFEEMLDEGRSDGCELPDYINEIVPHLESVRKKIKDLKNNDRIEMVIGL